MTIVAANGIQIAYDVFGESSSPPLVLVMGLGGQMILWDVEFCEQLAEKGHFVIRFDNRDVGLSTKFEEAGIPDVMAAMIASMQGEPVESSYSLDDMADDAAGLLDALNIDKAHICGVSMGGMIAQVFAYRNPSRILSLTSIMSNTGNPELPQGKPEALMVVTTPAPEEREAFIEYGIKFWQTIGSPGFPFDEERVRKMSAESYDRSYYPQGMARQFMAILAHGDRRSSLGSVTVPTLVIHGADDPLVPVEGGKDTAAAVPGAELFIIEGMGHDLPRGAWPQIVDAISNHSKKANS